MKQPSLFILFLIGAVTIIKAQDKETSAGIKFTGFVKTDVFYDTRQSSSSNGLREGHFYLFPDNVLYDSLGNDLNANSSLHLLSIQTRLKGDITGPDAFGAKTSGLIEAEFFGTGESDINGFRLRHAFVKLEWPKTILLTGQSWHPMFPAESFPGTVSFNTGAPFTPFSRNPQIRLTRKIGKSSLALTAYGQRDFVSSGPDGNTNKYMRNSGLPGINLQFRGSTGDVFTGSLGVDYKTLRPELKTAVNVENNEKIGSLAAFSILSFKPAFATISLMGIYAQNATDLVMLGGYGVSKITDPGKKLKKYTNLNTASFWADLSTNGQKIKFGFFSGYSKNLGANEDIIGPVYGRGTDIDYLFRVAPRLIFTAGGLSFAGELESTTAAYGTAESDGTVTNTKNVTNIRLLLSTIYRF